MADVTQLETKPDELKAIIERLKRMFDDQVELDRLLAKLKRSKFSALVTEGFTEEQALRIVLGR